MFLFDLFFTHLFIIGCVCVFFFVPIEGTYLSNYVKHVLVDIAK